MILAVADMSCRGVNTRKVTAIVEKLYGLEFTATQVGRAARVYLRGLHPDIDVEGGPRVAMSGQCMGADNEVLNPLVAKSFQNLDEMRIHPIPFQ